MKNIIEFRAKKKEILPNESFNYSDIEGVVKVFLYDGVEIAELKNKEYYLILGRRDHSGSLEELESLLWDWYKDEINPPNKPSQKKINKQSCFKCMIFVSTRSNTYYLWNGFETIVIKESENKRYSKNRHIGKVMRSFKKVKFEEIYKTPINNFYIKENPYKIITKN